MVAMLEEIMLRIVIFKLFISIFVLFLLGDRQNHELLLYGNGHLNKSHVMKLCVTWNRNAEKKEATI